MKIMSFLTALICCINGINAWICFKINPDWCHSIVIDTSAVPSAVEEMKGNGFAQLSEMEMYYEVYGEGEKNVVLIHGNGGYRYSLHDAATYLANDYTVYVVEERCHGESTDCDEITYDLMAKDIAEFIRFKELDKPIVIGHSDGAIVGLTLAHDYPDLPGAVLAYGANSSPEAAWFQFRFWVNWENLLEKDKLNDLMLSGPYFTEEYLSKISCPCYIVSSSHDLMPITDTIYMAKYIKNSEYNIIKDGNHGSYISDDGKQAYALSRAYLDKIGM